MKLLPDWPSPLYRPFCNHPSTSAEATEGPDGVFRQTHWSCLRCGKTRGAR